LEPFLRQTKEGKWPKTLEKTEEKIRARKSTKIHLQRGKNLLTRQVIGRAQDLLLPFLPSTFRRQCDLKLKTKNRPKRRPTKQNLLPKEFFNNNVKHFEKRIQNLCLIKMLFWTSKKLGIKLFLGV
jgi:hypothetical protein